MYELFEADARKLMGHKAIWNLLDLVDSLNYTLLNKERQILDVSFSDALWNWCELR